MSSFSDESSCCNSRHDQGNVYSHGISSLWEVVEVIQIQHVNSIRDPDPRRAGDLREVLVLIVRIHDDVVIEILIVWIRDAVVIEILIVWIHDVVIDDVFVQTILTSIYSYHTISIDFVVVVVVFARTT